MATTLGYTVVTRSRYATIHLQYNGTDKHHFTNVADCINFLQGLTHCTSLPGVEDYTPVPTKPRRPRITNAARKNAERVVINTRNYQTV